MHARTYNQVLQMLPHIITSARVPQIMKSDISLTTFPMIELIECHIYVHMTFGLYPLQDWWIEYMQSIKWRILCTQDR